MLMKVLYYSQNSFSDVDLSLLSTLQKYADVYYVIPLRKGRLKGTAVNIQNQYNKTGIFKASVYPELAHFSRLIDLDKMFVVNCCAKAGFSLRHIYVNIMLFKFIFSQRFDIIHLTMFPCYFEFPFYLFRKKVVLTVHDPLPHSCDISYINHLYRKISFRLFSNFVILNKTQKKEFIEYYSLYNKKILESKLSTYTYLRMYRNDIAKNKINYILFFGRITPYKGIDYLLRAMKIVHSYFPDVKLVIAGKGNFSFDISEYLELDYIEIRNQFLDDKELVLLIQNSLFVVCPYTDATQSGVVMSAFAFDKPVVATDVGGLPEMVVNNRFGLIVPPNDYDLLASSMIKLLDNSDLLHKLSDNIHKEYSNGEQSWDIISKGLIDFYSSVMFDYK